MTLISQTPLRLLVLPAIWWTGCAEDTKPASVVFTEVRPVETIADDGSSATSYSYSAAAHIHATATTVLDHNAGTEVQETASLDARGYADIVDRWTSPGTGHTRLDRTYDPTTALLVEESELFVDDPHLEDTLQSRRVFTYQSGRQTFEGWESWTTVSGRRQLDTELTYAFPLSDIVPRGNHGQYFAFITHEVRYASAGSVRWSVEASGGSARRPTRFDYDDNGDGAVDRTDYTRYDTDARDRVTAIHTGCPTEACDHPERSHIIELDDGQLARIQVWEAAGDTLEWRSTTHFRWSAHPFDGPTGAHLDMQTRSPDDAPLDGWTERHWDGDGWETRVFNQSEDLVGTLFTQTETVELELVD